MTRPETSVVRPLFKKCDLAKYLGVSTRQVEILLSQGRLPLPIRLAESGHPRWRLTDIERHIDELASAAST